MKKISLFIFASILAVIGYSQQLPLQSQYQFNYATINPAASGENDFYRVRASFRDQWVGLTDSPISTQILTVTKGFGNNGLGATVFSDKTGGIFNTTGAVLSYSHKVKFAEKSDLYFGVSGGVSKINLIPTNDPAVLSNNDVAPDFNFGVYYTHKNIKIGVSIPGLLNANYEITDSDENTKDRHFYTMLSYEKALNEDWSIFPSVLVKTTANNNQIDANINFKLKNRLWFGTSYRQDFGPTIYVGIDFGKLLSVYSYDISTNEVADYSSGSHEFTLGYDFISDSESENKIKESVEESVEGIDNIEDKDKDGITDKDDLCPDEYGIALANGCPDFDKDGIPDKYDLCPHLFGNLSAQGCPELAVNESMILSKALKDLNFDFDKSDIKYESFPSLTNLAVLMHKNPDMILYIEGHASTEGSASHNLNLSAMRVKEVQKFFIGRGVKKNRLIMDFYGAEFPLNFNLTDKEKEKNRRVEFDIKYHLYDSDIADNLINVYDSLLNNLYGGSTFLEEKKVIEVLQAEQVSTDLETGKDTVINKKLIDNTVSIEQDNSNQYLVVVQVFNDLSNAIEFTNSKDLEYTFLNNKYYIYAFSGRQRLDAENFRNQYNNECWILDTK